MFVYLFTFIESFETFYDAKPLYLDIDPTSSILLNQARTKT